MDPLETLAARLADTIEQALERRQDRILFRLADACRMLGMSERTLREQIRDGRLRGRRLERDWFFTRSDLEAFVETMEKSS